MPYEDAEQNMRLFAKEVMPALQKLRPGAPPPRPRATADRPGASLLGS
jgi:hypothetical protein